MRQFHSAILASFLLCLAAGSALAQVNPSSSGARTVDQPAQAAGLKVFSPAPTALVWDGRYSGSKAIDLCLISPSGSFRLDVENIADSAAGPPMPLKLRLTDRGGAAQEVLAQPGSTVVFNGSAPLSSPCVVANARLDVSLDGKAALGAVAGAYTYNFRFAISAR